MKVIRLVTNLFWQALSYKEKGNLLLCLVIITQVGAQVITRRVKKTFYAFSFFLSAERIKNGAFIITTTNNNSKRLHIWRRLYDFWLFSAQHNKVEINPAWLWQQLFVLHYILWMRTWMTVLIWFQNGS